MSRLLFWTNSPHTLTSYGLQTRAIITRLREMGHEVAVATNFGVLGAAIDWNGITIYPAREKAIDAELTGFYARHFGADVVVSLYDVWALPENTRQQLDCPWIAMIPVDGAPVSERMYRRIQAVDWPVAFSQFGQQELARVGVKADLVPLGVDCQTFCTGNKTEARTRLGISQDIYLVTMVAANKGFPARKSWPEAMTAFAQFHARHSEARLYLHTTAQPFGSKGRGIYLKPLARELGITDAVIFAGEGELAVGVPDEQMADIFRASDVLLNPAMGEGFCLPAAEAQACGCPVITQDCSAMSELTINGIAVEPLQPYWLPQLEYWWQQASVERIGDALEKFYLLSDEAREFMADGGVGFIKNHYDWDIVMQHYWRPFLSRVEAELW